MTHKSSSSDLITNVEKYGPKVRCTRPDGFTNVIDYQDASLPMVDEPGSVGYWRPSYVTFLGEEL